MAMYWAFGTVLLLLAITAPLAMLFGLGSAMAARSVIAPLRWIGKAYMAIVRGIPDIVFFLFFVIALDQGFEYLRHKVKCPDWPDAIRQGNDFIVCQAAKLPLGNAPQWIWVSKISSIGPASLAGRNSHSLPITRIPIGGCGISVRCWCFILPSRGCRKLFLIA